MADELQPGDVVQLNTGGPQMSLQYLAYNHEAGVTMARCAWFPPTFLSLFGGASEPVLRTADFALASLIRHDPQEMSRRFKERAEKFTVPRSIGGSWSGVDVAASPSSEVAGYRGEVLLDDPTAVVATCPDEPETPREPESRPPYRGREFL